MLPNLKRIVYETSLRLAKTPDGFERESDHELEGHGPVASVYRHRGAGLLALLSLSVMEDSSVWVHMSVSWQGKAPNWEHLQGCKNLFLGEETEAQIVLPAQADMVNMAHCWHVWMQLDRATHERWVREGRLEGKPVEVEVQV